MPQHTSTSCSPQVHTACTPALLLAGLLMPALYKVTHSSAAHAYMSLQKPALLGWTRQLIALSRRCVRIYACSQYLYVFLKTLSS